MKLISTPSHFSRFSSPLLAFTPKRSSISLLGVGPSQSGSLSLGFRFKPCRSLTASASASSTGGESAETPREEVFGDEDQRFHVEVGNPSLPSPSVAKLSLSDKAFFLLPVLACTTSVAFMGFVIAAVPTILAFGRAATSLSKLADTAREELPSTMAALRLTGIEISDLTLELSDLSHEISEGVAKSSQTVQAAEAGLRQIGKLARKQTISMIQERASLPIISLQPVVVGAAKKTTGAVGKATRSLLNMISGEEDSSGSEDFSDN